MADTAPSNAFVAFERVQKSYDGETLVVKDLNLSMPKGEFLTMLGPSGSGKTTCLMMLAGFETATHGEIKLDGRPINNIPPHKRGIGMVFQNYALFPHMTVAENLAFPLEVRKIGDRRRPGVVAREKHQELPQIPFVGGDGVGAGIALAGERLEKRRLLRQERRRRVDEDGVAHGPPNSSRRPVVAPSSPQPCGPAACGSAGPKPPRPSSPDRLRPAGQCSARRGPVLGGRPRR